MSPSTDIVVLGGGGSGLAAAVSAAEHGARVILLQKAPQVGGSTALSVGAFTAAGTSLQKKAGIVDSVDEFIADIQTSNGPLDPEENVELRRMLAEEAAPTLEWLMGMGVRFLGPFPEPPHQHPRMHNVLPNSRSYTTALARRARERGVTIVVNSPANEILLDPTGRVTGVRSGTTEYTARRGVIIATGDYTASRELLGEWVGGTAGSTRPANPDNTGDGQRLGTAAGGHSTGVHLIFETLRYPPRARPDLLKALPAAPWFTRLAAPFARRMPKPLFAFFARGALVGWLAPSPAMYNAGAIQVDAHTGRRIADETNGAELARAVGANGDRSYMVFDSSVARAFSRGGSPVATFPGVASAFLEDVRRRRPDVVTEAARIAELATMLRLRDLPGTVTAWNAAVAAGEDTAFGRTALGGGLHTGPFIALGPLESVAPLSNGGLAIDTACRVLNDAGEPIPGLYAAGSAGQGGLLLFANGLHIAWAHTSGRIAGRTAAQD